MSIEKKNDSQEKAEFEAALKDALEWFKTNKNVRLYCDSKDFDQKGIKALDTILTAAGLYMNVTPGTKETIVGFGVHENKFKAKIKRGRKKKCEKNHAACTVGELKSKMKDMKDFEVMEAIGCPKSTFYRIKKMLKAMGCDMKNADPRFDNKSIWDYTS